MLTLRDVSKVYELEQSLKTNRYLDMLTATVSHEIVTPLNCIITFVSALNNVRDASQEV